MTTTSRTFWLRSESKKNEYRRALTPDSCEQIIAAGHKVIVEDWKESIIPTKDYENIGCEIVKDGSWVNDAPKEAIIVGLKALPDQIEEFKHTHIYFAHCYKQQDGWRELMIKFDKGGGKIIDLEFMVDENGRRTNAFGYWAGYVGAALGSLFAKAENLDEAINKLKQERQFPDKKDLIKFIKDNTSETGSAIVIGRNGRSGSGAADLLSDIGWSTTGWDQAETSPGGPFKEILSHDLFVNCVLAMKPMPPFITRELIEENEHKLKVISDVSCDPDSDKNMVPLYDEATVLDAPLKVVTSGNNPVSITAIDNLPSILPKESSFDFSSQLSKFIIEYNEDSGPVKRALDLFDKTMNTVK